MGKRVVGATFGRPDEEQYMAADLCAGPGCAAAGRSPVAMQNEGGRSMERPPSLYAMWSSPSCTSTVRVSPAVTAPAMMARLMRVSTVCWRYRRRGRAP